MCKIGEPSAGFRRFRLAAMMVRASSCASSLNGRWTAIWSPSKSALKPRQTNGCSWIARPSIRTGWKACMLRRCKLGARFSRTYLPLMTSSRASQTTVSLSSIKRVALRMLWACSLAINSPITNGLKSSIAIILGNPHWWIFSSGPDTITERPE